MSTLGFRIQDMRPVTLKGVVAFFNISFGVENEDGDFTGLFTVRDFALKTKNDGGFWMQSPGKPRKDKSTGQPVMKDGYPVYDNYFDLYKVDGAGKDGKYGATKQSWNFQDQLTDAAGKLYQSLSGKPKQAPESVATGIKETRAGSPVSAGGDEDDDFPF